MVLYKVIQSMPAPIKLPLDITAILASWAAWLGLISTALTIIATLLSVVWLGIRLWEWYNERKVG